MASELLHFRSGTATMAHRFKVLAVLVKLDGARATRRLVQGLAFTDKYGADLTATALHQLRADGMAEFEGSGLGRRWWVTDAGRAHHAQVVEATAGSFGAGA